MALVVAVVTTATGAGCGGSFSNPETAPDAGFFVVATSAPVVRDRQNHTATLLDNGEVLLCGGTSATAGGLVAQAERYRTSGQLFFAAGTLGAARARHTGTLLDDDTVLIWGGEGAGATVLASAEIYTPVSGNGSFAGAPGATPSARRNHTATLTNDGTVLGIGGDAGGAPLTSIERYTPGSGFSAAGTLVTARTRHMARPISGSRVWVAGGGTAAGGGSPTADIEVVDMANGSSRLLSQGLAQPRAGATAVTLSDGRILVCGGFGVTGAALDSAEVYDPVNERRVASLTMTKARGSARATRLYDGRVLVIGDDASADLFDPSTSTFVAPASGGMAQPRTNGHTVTSLFSVEVLIFGGGPANAPAELFDPR